MTWIYLSPHPDDVALSCGGLVWEQTHLGEAVGIWTICAGDVPPGPLSPFAEAIHTDRWKTGKDAPEKRRVEDADSCRVMGATPRYFSIPDCIYRRAPGNEVHLYASEEALFSPIHPAEESLVEAIGDELMQNLSAEVILVCPLTLGNHVDHCLTRAAAERLGLPMWYYADYPYVLRTTEQQEQYQQSGWKPVEFPISEEGLKAWVEAVGAHASQISTFWPDTEAMRATLSEYRQQTGGVCLWRRPESG
jgi:LmbE family N-acetylglucosaminyl deacetylase